MPRTAALVTGASRGIGAATARLLANNGYAVAVNYCRDLSAALGVVETIRNAGGAAIAMQADVSVPAQVSALFQQVDEELGTLAVLVNNAGIVGPRCRVEELSYEDLQHMLAVNVSGPVLCTQQAIVRMSTAHGGIGGAIVNVSSGSAYIGNPHRGVHYAMTKGALNSFSTGASQELVAEGIRINSVSPGMTVTDMTADSPLETFSNLPMGRGAEPEEVAEAIVWLADSKASYVAGANIRVGGGRP